MLNVTEEEFRSLLEELGRMEDTLEQLGNIRYTTSDGEVYAMHEQALKSSVHDQKRYDDYKALVLNQRRLIEAINMLVQFRLASAKPDKLR